MGSSCSTHTAFPNYLIKGDLNGVTRCFQQEFLEREIDCQMRPIHFACLNGLVDIAKYLIDRKCNLECETVSGWRPIHFASCDGHLDILKLLVSKRCELQCKNRDGFTPMDLARKYKHQACEYFLNETVKLAQHDEFTDFVVVYKHDWQRKEINEFFDCIRRNDCQILEGLNSGDVLIREEPGTGLSFLEVALQSNATEVIKYFLDKKVDHAEIPLLKHYIENCPRPVAIELILECLLYRSIRCNDAAGFEISCLACIVNGRHKIVSSSFLEIAIENGTSTFINEILRRSICNKEEWTRAKNLANLKGYNEILDTILVRESQENPIPDEVFPETSEDMIMISYCRKDKEIVKRIYYELKKRGFKLWIDFENMENEMNQSMAVAVEQSKAVIICVSSGYQGSKNCRKEMIYAEQLNKCIIPVTIEKNFTPGGWLAFNLAERLRCNMSGKYDFQTSMSKLIEHLDRQVINKKLCFEMTVFKRASQCNSERLMDHSDLRIVTESDFNLLHADPELLELMFMKASRDVKQSVIEKLLQHFAINDKHDAFVKVLETKIIEPKLFSNGETLFTSLLKAKTVKYCWGIIHCPVNREYFNLANVLKQMPLQIAIETELYDLLYPLIIECDQLDNEDNGGNTPLMQLFQKLSNCTDISIENKLMIAVKLIIYKGGNIYKETLIGTKIIELCSRLDLRTKIEAFQNNLERKDSKIIEECIENNICNILH